MFTEKIPLVLSPSFEKLTKLMENKIIFIFTLVSRILKMQQITNSYMQYKYLFVDAIAIAR